MGNYSRPAIAEVEFRDDAGEIIPYGRRWEGEDGPPEDSYSVVDHPERFAPLLDVAEAIMLFLQDNYQVQVEEGLDVVAGLPHAPDPEFISKAIRLTPIAENAAPLTFVLTKLPGVRIYAGALFDSPIPSCGCDACDEHWEECADQLEEQVFAIVAGGLTEHVSRRKLPKWRFERGIGLVRSLGQTVSYQLLLQDQESRFGGEMSADTFSREVLADTQRRLKPVHAASAAGNWLPWTRK